MHSDALKEVSASERLLLTTYNVRLPPDSFVTSSSSSVAEDDISTKILDMFQPLLKQEKMPVVICGDGNCFYRAVALAVFGSQAYHSQLRLMCTLEIVENMSSYDLNDKDFVDLLGENRHFELPQVISKDCNYNYLSSVFFSMLRQVTQGLRYHFKSGMANKFTARSA